MPARGGPYLLIGSRFDDMALGAKLQLRFVPDAGVGTVWINCTSAHAVASAAHSTTAAFTFAAGASVRVEVMGDELSQQSLGRSELTGEDGEEEWLLT